MNNGLQVRIDGVIVGSLWLDNRKRFCFQYDEGWFTRSRMPLSLSLPLRREPYLDDESHPFFANLLPEEKMRSVIARNLGVSLNNDYGLLEKIGGDCAGAVSLYPATDGSQGEPGSYRQLSLDELNAVIAELPKRPLLAGENGIRLSLAGAQKKLPVYYDEGHFSLGLGAAASNYIIKPAIEDLDGTVENEAFCMALAQAVGLAVPRSFIHQHGDAPRVFVVKRYDRSTTAEGIRRLHQEDFCQALGIPPEFKYETEGGPSLAACFKLVRHASTRSGKDVLSLVDWVIFNYLTGNSDAHGKNVSLLLPEGPVLAPFYDLISTRIYAHYGLASGLAMKIGGAGDPDALRKMHWEQFAEEVGVKPRLVLNRIANLAKRIEDARLQLFKSSFAPYRCDALYRLMEFIGGQAERILRRIA